ncbi:MAG: hypothetical protein HKM07_00135 [Chlamydiae bacterium]|nr:hypothetical protein [Chlamydiota bacterium]
MSANALSTVVKAVTPYIPTIATTINSASQLAASAKDIALRLGVNSPTVFPKFDVANRHISFATTFFYAFSSIIGLREIGNLYNKGAATKAETAFGVIAHGSVGVGTAIDALQGLGDRNVVSYKLDSSAADSSSALFAVGTAVMGGLALHSASKAKEAIANYEDRRTRLQNFVNAFESKGTSAPEKDVDDKKDAFETVASPAKSPYDEKGMRESRNKQNQIIQISVADDRNSITWLTGEITRLKASIPASYAKAAQAAFTTFAQGLIFTAKYSELLKSPMLHIGAKALAAFAPIAARIALGNQAVLHSSPLASSRAAII